MAEPETKDVNLEDLRKEENNGLILDSSANKLGDDDDLILKPEKKEETKAKEIYEGKGAVVEGPMPVGGDSPVVVGPLKDSARQDDVKKKYKEIDDEIIKLHRQFMEARKNTDPASLPSDKRQALDADVTILIDKLDAGKIEFSEDEKKRIDRAKRIKIVEVENKELQAIKITKKFDKETDKKYIKKTFNRSLASVIALGSCYTAKMRNFSALESIQMMQRPGEDTVKTNLEKWSVLYEKLTDPSCGAFKDFDDFLSHTAYLDYNNFIYAILCSSYPEKDSVSFTCNQPNCGKRFRVEYENKDLIRKDKISPEQADIMRKIVTATSNADSNEGRRLIEEESAVSGIKRFALDDNSGFIIDIHVPSVKYQIDNILPNIDPSMNQTVAVMCNNIMRILMPTEETADFDNLNDMEFVEVIEYADIYDVVKDMNEYQWKLINDEINAMIAPYTIQYGIKEVVCPHCKHSYGEMPLDLDDLLFQRVQQRILTQRESQASTN